MKFHGKFWATGTELVGAVDDGGYDATDSGLIAAIDSTY